MYEIHIFFIYTHTHTRANAEKRIYTERDTFYTFIGETALQEIQNCKNVMGFGCLQCSGRDLTIEGVHWKRNWPLLCCFPSKLSFHGSRMGLNPVKTPELHRM